MTFNTKHEKQQRGGAGSAAAKAPGRMHHAIHKRDSEATEMGITLLDEFDFPHAVFPIGASSGGSSEMTAEGLKYAYQKVSTFLDFKSKQDLGITVLIAPQFLFACTISQAYHQEKKTLSVDSEFGAEPISAAGQVPIYLDGFAYAGIVNLQDINQKWPATAGLGVKSHTILDTIKS